MRNKGICRASAVAEMTAWQREGQAAGAGVVSILDNSAAVTALSHLLQDDCQNASFNGAQ